MKKAAARLVGHRRPKTNFESDFDMTGRNSGGITDLKFPTSYDARQYKTYLGNEPSNSYADPLM